MTLTRRGGFDLGLAEETQWHASARQVPGRAADTQQGTGKLSGTGVEQARRLAVDDAVEDGEVLVEPLAQDALVEGPEHVDGVEHGLAPVLMQPLQRALHEPLDQNGHEAEETPWPETSARKKPR